MTLKVKKGVEKELSKIIQSGINNDQKIMKIAYLIVQGQSETKTLLKRGFAGLAIQNAQLLEKNQGLQDRIVNLQEQLEIVTEELLERKQQEKLMEERKFKRKNRKRLPPRQPITIDIYNAFIEDSKKLRYGHSYRGARLRLALALLAVTGCRVSELLPLRMEQVQTLFQKDWIKIDRAKRGPASHKAFLTKEGAKIIRDRRSDFEFISHFKNSDSHIFTAENSEKPLERESFTALINQFLQDSARKLEGQPILSSHSFRIGFITQLWKDTKDIEFVKQAIGHVNIDTTSQYVQEMSDQERQQRMQTISATT